MIHDSSQSTLQSEKKICPGAISKEILEQFQYPGILQFFVIFFNVLCNIWYWCILMLLNKLYRMRLFTKWPALEVIKFPCVLLDVKVVPIVTTKAPPTFTSMGPPLEVGGPQSIQNRTGKLKVFHVPVTLKLRFSPLKMDGWKMNFLLGRLGLFSGTNC